MIYGRRKIQVILVAVVSALLIHVGTASATTEHDSVFQTIRTIFEVVESYHKDGADLDKFFAGAVRGGLEAMGDPYTNYFPPQDFANFLDSLDGNVTGIGVYLEFVDDYVVVAAPIKGSPALRAGLQTGDRILEADGTTLVGGSIEKAQQLIRGEPGTNVLLKVERPSESRTFQVRITRETIHIPLVESKMLEQNVGYIAISSFGSSADTEFYAAVKELKEQGAASLVLDLRQNPGGYVGSAVSIAGAWIPSGAPVMYEVRKTSEERLTSPGNLIDLQTAVLVDGGSASASEILAGAIQDYNAGTLVGTRTFGKGTVQQMIFMSDRSGLKVTVAEYLTAKRRHVHGTGLIPDVVVEPNIPTLAFKQSFAPERLLSAGNVGLDVLDLQKRLAFLGYETELDGIMGSKTIKAIHYLAWDHGASPSGVVDSALVALLNQAVQAEVIRQSQVDIQLQKAIELLRR